MWMPFYMMSDSGQIRSKYGWVHTYCFIWSLIIVYDNYDVCPENARGIIIDPATHNTVAVIMIY